MIKEWLDEPCVIVGGGATALRAAVTCLEQGLSPLLISKMPTGQSHSLIAEGGVNAALGTLDDDTWREHVRDTVASGHQLNDSSMVELLCREAPDRLRDLHRYGAGLPTDKAGRIIQSGAGSGGQHHLRVIAVSDFIGFVIQRTLLKKALMSGLRMIDDAICVELLESSSGGVGGIVVFDGRRQTFFGIRSPRVLLATGGAGQLYSMTTNTHDATGEGYVMAYDVGAELRDMEMIQFHPTALAAPVSGRGLLITEAARGIGGVLRNREGDRFMKRYAPQEMELAPRDVVTRAICSEVLSGNGTPHDGVWLDLTHVDDSVIDERLRNTQRLVLQYQGSDLRRAPVEVAPAAHHVMGGVASNGDSMECVSGLFVAGEVSWGVHGANRLGGNALAETQVFGHRAALSILGSTRGAAPPLDKEALAWKPQMLRSHKFSDDWRDSVSAIREDLQRVMSTHVGFQRSAQGLGKGREEIGALGERFDHVHVPAHFHGVGAYLECQYMLRLASLIIKAADIRQETRGAHVRVDFPSEWRQPKSTVLSREEEGLRCLL